MKISFLFFLVLVVVGICNLIQQPYLIYKYLIGPFQDDALNVVFQQRVHLRRSESKPVQK